MIDQIVTLERHYDDQATPWLDLVGILPAGRLIKANVTANNADGSVVIATSAGATIRAAVAEAEWGGCRRRVRTGWACR